MTDKELLEFAAKAAGIKLGAGVDEHGAFEENWNPLKYDADAFRVAVHLKIDVQQAGGIGTKSKPYTAVIAGYGVPFKSGSFSWHDVAEPVGSDRYAATRLAIVRAAAEIGKAMP